MDVHAHTPTARKKWTHYFWEFLMLFLAVFCGFLAEYKLEHKIEKDRGKQYAKSMYDDLKMDTAQLNSVIQARVKRNEMLDSLFHLIDNPQNYLSDLYFYARHITRTAPVTFFNNDRTIQQLKNSGGLRLIANRNVSDSIILYDQQVRLIQNRQDGELENTRECFQFCAKIFNSRVFEKMINADNVLFRPAGNPELLKYSEQDINSFLGYLQLVKANNMSNNYFTKFLQIKAVNLLKTIKNEYHLE